MIISIASGKGGTGKTTIAVNLALALGNVQLLDCDVEEPNAAIFLKPKFLETQKAHILVPEINKSKCTYCGVCRDACEYNALAVLAPKKDTQGAVMIFAQLCHGCGACSMLCPEGAIKEVPREIGVIEIGMRDNIQFAHGRLNIGEAMAPPLIRQVKSFINPTRTAIIDAPPGTSCPVITAVKGSDSCILVTEPTPFGLNDLRLAVETLRELRIPHAVVINRSDIGDSGVKDYCAAEGIPIVMEIPFKREIAHAYARGIPLIEAMPEYKKDFLRLCDAAVLLAGNKK